MRILSIRETFSWVSIFLRLLFIFLYFLSYSLPLDALLYNLVCSLESDLLGLRVNACIKEEMVKKKSYQIYSFLFGIDGKSFFITTKTEVIFSHYFLFAFKVSSQVWYFSFLFSSWFYDLFCNINAKFKLHWVWKLTE